MELARVRQPTWQPCHPSHLAAVAVDLGKRHDLKVEVLDRKQVEKLGMGSFPGGGQGPGRAAQFIVAQYHGAAKTQAPVVLVGKGITFDSGGISPRRAPRWTK